MDNGTSITNVAYQSDQDTDRDVSKKGDQITEFIHPICEEIDKNQNILENFPSIYESSEDVKVEERTVSDIHYLFNVKRAEPNHYVDYQSLQPQNSTIFPIMPNTYKMVKHMLKFLQQMLQDFSRLFGHFQTEGIKELKDSRAITHEAGKAVRFFEDRYKEKNGKLKTIFLSGLICTQSSFVLRLIINKIFLF